MADITKAVIDVRAHLFDGIGVRGVNLVEVYFS